MNKAVFMLSAAFALAGLSLDAPALAAPQGSAAKLRLPPPKAPPNQIFSAGAIARDLEKRGYQIQKMKRKGTTYSITAIGPNKNKVQMTVDGRSGDIIGLAVLEAAAGLASAIAAIVKSGKGARYVDDRHPFGILIPDTYTSRWVPITTWTYTTDYVVEPWSGAGYRFAVPYDTIRPGHNGYSVTTFDVAELKEPIYEVYDYNGTEISTEYSEESWEISATESWEESFGAYDEQMEASYLDGTVDEDADIDMDDVADYDSEDGDFEITDTQDDGYDADIGDDDDEDDSDADMDEDDDSDEADDPDDDDDGDDGDYDDGGDDDGGDDDYDDGGDEDPGLTVAE